MNIPKELEKMGNKFYFRDGRNFVVNPETEEKPGDARQAKKVFLLTINPVDLKTDKAWTVEAIRALATGLIEVTTGKKRATKAELIERLEAYIKDERAIVLTASQTFAENLELCGYSSDSLLEMLVNLTGDELVNEIERSLLVKGYAPSTIVKTLMPDVVKSINAHYKGHDKNEVIAKLQRQFRPMRIAVDKEGIEKVAQNSHNRRPVCFNVLFEHLKNILENWNTASWKELSIALSLVTGRRMAEVHGVKTKFVKTGNKTVLFEGQLKTKGRGEIPPYEIPTLVDADLVINAWNKLKEMGKGDYEPGEVNRKLSKSLSTELPMGLKKILKDNGITEYSDLRDTYAAKLLQSRPEHMTDNAYLSTYLGHGEDDVNTANTYQKLMLVEHYQIPVNTSTLVAITE